MPVRSVFQLLVEDIVVEVVRKPVRQVRLSVRAPHGQLRVTVPLRTTEATIREVVLRKQAWIRHHQTAMLQRPPVPELRYETGETHYYQGQAWRLCVLEQVGRPHVRLAPAEATLYLVVPVGATSAQRAQVLARWRRTQLQAQVPGLLAKWEPVVGAQAADWGIKQMRTRWGTCSIRARRIWLSLELSQWPLSCLEYVLVHELTHLHERLHSKRFWALVGQAMPNWQTPHLHLKHGSLAALA
ncbi:M48 family metallopeptidase [Siccationidurans ginsengisoli]|uniref:YgjP-like metallopeptidase domain-containing protein n=1 Tax=Hymenobacter TaxID=89966 RepID=UPI001AAC9FE5|nr:SprT family zinc-dependent metalloprotease [Hymenobacter sp. KCTC 23674]MBO2033672.1 M48 family metallopeptidase [Hymenobacter sp. BT559]